MAERKEVGFKSDSQVALELFNKFLSYKELKDTQELFKDHKKLLSVFSSFVYATKYCNQVTDFK